MAFLKNYRNSKLLQDPFLCELVDDIMGLNPGECCQRTFDKEGDVKSYRSKLYTLMNGMEIKESYKVRMSKGKLFYKLEITKTVGGAIKSCDHYVGGEQ